MAVSGKISFSAAVLMSLNVTIGVGIFFLPQAMAQLAGDVSFWGWALAPLLLAPAVWNLIMASQLFPGAGGFYNYGAQGLGEFWGFIASWTYLIGLSTAAAAQLSIFLTDILYKHFPCQSMVDFPALWIVGAVLCIVLLNLFDVRLISRVQSCFTLLKLTPIFVVIGVLLFACLSGSLNPSLTLIPKMSDASAILYTLPLTIFGFWGMETTCSISDQIEGGTKKAALAIATAFGIAVILYAFFHLGVLHLMGTKQLIASGVSSLPDFMGLSGSRQDIVATCFRGALMINYLNAAYGVCLYCSTNIYHLARAKLLSGSKVLTQKNTFDRPLFSIALEGAIIALIMLCVRNPIAQTGLANLGIVGALVVTTMANIAMLRRKADYSSMIPAVLGLGTCLALIYFSWISMGVTIAERCMNAIPSCFVVVFGIGMYLFQQRAKASTRRSA